jgi:hypothetical protein
MELDVRRRAGASKHQVPQADTSVAAGQLQIVKQNR